MRALASSIAPLLLLALACGGTPASTTTGPTPPAPTDGDAPDARGEAIAPACGYAFKALYIVPDDPLQAEALVEVDRATTLLDAGDPATAARRFLGCAEVLRQAPAGEPRANENAEICYYDAAYAFATAGAWAREGRQALADAQAAEEPVTAAYIGERLLADPPVDCAPAAP